MIIPLIFILASAFSAPQDISALQTEDIKNPETLGAYVREYYKETPVLANIAWCESRMRHVGKDGEIFRGVVNDKDIGVMQINTRFHEATATDMGIDLYSLQGNLEYAKYLYEKEGTKPWKASKSCWGNK
ncbi:hypothetical protein K2P56_01005 [Patescibacteria group bacterium]|nr:hypothetical protein [Patescibacteria group bacterium]